MLSESLQNNNKLVCQQNKSGFPHCNISKSKLTHRLNNFFFLNPIILGRPKSWQHQWLSKFKCLVPVGMLPECGSPDWKGIAKSWCLPGHPPTVWHQFWSLHLIWRTCDAALVAAMPYLDYFLLLFFLACSKLHFCNLLLQKIKFSGLKAKDVYHSHPYIKDIFWLLELTHLWASVHISTHVAVIYPLSAKWTFKNLVSSI